MTRQSGLSTSDRIWPLAGAVCGGLAVALGAFGAHGLKTMVADGRFAPEMLTTFETAVRYQMYHALALVALGGLRLGDRRCGTIAGIAFLVGIVIFSGMLYAYVFTGVTTFALIVPIGGVSFIVGWVAMAISLWSNRNL